MKKQLLLLSFLSLPIWCMEKSVKVDESPASVKQNALAMIDFCQRKCSLPDDILQRCTNKCFHDYSEQYENFLISKYTNKCAGSPFNETWSYKDGIEGQVKDLAETSRALTKWEDPSIRQCAQAHLNEFHRILQSQSRIASSQVKELEEQHPLIAKKIKVASWIRRIKD